MRIHHSHITGKITGYAHSFSNMKVRVNQIEFSWIAHNYLNFYIHFMLRGYRVSFYGEDINIGASNLSNVNFSNIGQQMKIIDMMKYFQTSLARVASTVSSGEKERINELMLHFWVRHGIFRKVWLTLTQDVKGKNYRCFI